jgi:hypothetical protein
MLRRTPFNCDVVALDLFDPGGAARELALELAAIGGEPAKASVMAQVADNLLKSAAGQGLAAIVALDSLAARVVGRWRRRHDLVAPLVGVVGDAWIDRRWADSGVDRLVVLDEPEAAEALGIGFSSESVVPLGLPICGRFFLAAKEHQLTLRQRFHLPEDQSVVLITIADLEAELSSLVFQLGLLVDSTTVLIDVGSQTSAGTELRKYADAYHVHAQVFGKTDDVALLWAAADLIVGRPRLPVVQRALAIGRPMLMLLPRGSAEEARSDYIHRRGLGLSVDHMSTFAAHLDLALQSTQLRSMKQRMGRFAATDRIARFIAQTADDGPRILAESRSGRVGSQCAGRGPVTAATSARENSPLEPIGPEGARVARRFQEWEVEKALAEIKRKLKEQ